MALLKQVSDRGATLAWSPLKHLPYAFASGTKEGGGGGFSDYGGELCVHQFDPSQPTTDCRTVASVKTQARFSSIAWGARSSRPSLTHGLIAGGMADGAVMLWDAGAVLGGSHDAVATISRHQSAVRALQFNPNPAAEHLLAAGGVDGDISIINLDNPGSPVLASPLAAGQRLETEITSLAWNTSVHHILATATVHGVVVVWDLKENKPWCHLRDPHRASISDLSWNPDDGLYLVTACDDDARPVLRVWDLRSSTTTPLCELSGGHTKGVLSVDWCPWDPNLLVSCGKDARTFVWDIQQGRPIAEIPAAAAAGGAAPSTAPAPLASSNPFGGSAGHDGFGLPSSAVFGAPPSGGAFGAAAGGDPFAVFGGGGGAGGGAGGSATLGGLGAGAGRRYLTRWSKRAPGLIASCSLDRCVSVHSVVAMGPAVAPKSLPAHIAGGTEATLRRAPRWLRRPVGASFSFGGKLVAFAAPAAAAKAELRVGAISYPKRLQIVSVTTGHDFVSRALEFEGVLGGLEAGTLDPRALCDSKAAEATARGATAAATAWAFMRMLFEQDARQRVLAYVGYDGAAIAAEMARYRRDEPASAAPPESGAAAEDGGAATQVDAAAPAPPEAALSQQEVSQPAWGGGFHVPALAAVASASDLFGSSSARADSQRPDDFFSALAPSAALPEATPTPAPAPGGPVGGESAPAMPAAPEPLPAAPEQPPSELQRGGEDPRATYERRRVPNAADDAVLRRALLVGDFPSAVAVCFEQDRFADALLLASCGSPDVWAAAKDEYFRRRTSPLTSSLSAIVRGDFASFVSSAPLTDWRDVLGLLCTYAKPDEFSGLCETLGDRLGAEADDATAACTVYMAALCTGKAIAVWVREAHARAASEGDSGLALQELIEKACILRHATYVTTGTPTTHGVQPEAADLARYCAILADEGFLPTAAFFAARVVDAGGDAFPAGAVLRHRLSRAFSNIDYAYPAAQALAHTPEPFAVANVGPAPQPVAHSPPPPHPGGHMQHHGEYTQQQQQQVYGGGFEGGHHASHADPSHYAPPSQVPPQQQQQQQRQYVTLPPPQAAPVQQIPHAPAPGRPVAVPRTAPSAAFLPGQAHHPAHAASLHQPPAPAAQPAFVPPASLQQQHTAAAGPALAAHPPVAVPTPAPQAYGPRPGHPVPAPPSYGSFGAAPQHPAAHAAPPPPPPAPAPAPAPAAPPAPLPVSPEMRAALDALSGTLAALGSLPLVATEQRQLQDAAKAVGVIETKVQEGRMSGDAAAKLCTLAAQCAAYDFHGAQKTQTELASIDWANTKEWLRGVRGMVSLALIKSAAGGR